MPLTSRVDALLVPHASGLLSGALEDSFAELRRALTDAREAVAASRPSVLVITCSELISVGPFRLVSARSFEGNLGGGSVPDTPYRYRGLEEDLVRNLVRRLRLSGVDSEVGLYEGLEPATAVALRLIAPDLDVPVLPIAVPVGSLRQGFRFGSVVADLLREHDLEPLFVAAGSLSHRLSKDPDEIREEGEQFDRELLGGLAAGEIDPLLALPARTLSAVAADAGLAHLSPLLGFVGDGFRARVLAYSGIFGAGNAVVAFRAGGRRTQELEIVGSGAGAKQ